MLDRAGELEQPLNPLLTVLPLGILGSAVLVDLGALISDSALLGAVALADMAFGILTAVVTFCAVLIALVIAPSGGLARQMLPLVAILIGSMTTIFMVIWSVRADGDRAVSGGTFLMELLALSAGIVAAVLTQRLALGRGMSQRYLDSASVTGRYLSTTAMAAGVLAGRFVSRHVVNGSQRVVTSSLRAAEVVRSGPLARLLR